jgi:hypothetical protein
MKRAADVSASCKALRDAAREAGAKTYDPCLPCAKGHEAMRYVATDYCVECKMMDNARARAAKGTNTKPTTTATAPAEIQSAVTSDYIATLKAKRATPTPPTATSAVETQSAVVETLGSSLKAAIFAEIGYNPFENDVEFAEDADGFAMGSPTSAPIGWQIVEPEYAVPQVPMLFENSPASFVARVAELLRDGTYKLQVDPDGARFIGTAREARDARKRWVQEQHA